MNVTGQEIERFMVEALRARDVRSDVREHVASGLVQASLRGVDSHGVRLFPHYVRALDAGRLNPQPEYRFDASGAATGFLDGDHTFGHAAGSEAMRRAIGLAQSAGVGVVAVRNSSHFGAAAYFALMAATKDMIGLSFTHADALVLSTNGLRPYFGTNPICFAAPSGGEEPFCYDGATSTVTWNKVRQYAERGDPIPGGWAADGTGSATNDPAAAIAVTPLGGHKGFGLAMVVDIVCSLLSGMAFGRNIISMYDDPIAEKRELGHLMAAIDVSRFVPVDEFKDKLRQMMEEVRAEPAASPNTAVMVPGDPEKKALAQRSRIGIELSAREMEEFSSLGRSHGITLATASE